MTDTSDNPRARFGVRFAMLARRWRRALDAHLVASGLSDATWVPLMHLHELGDGVTQKQLAARVGLDGSSLVRLLDILSRQGLLERRTDATDARARLVFLTQAGRARVAEIRKALVEAEAEMLQDISDAELAAMLGHFSLIEERLEVLQTRTTEGEPS